MGQDRGSGGDPRLVARYAITRHAMRLPTCLALALAACAPPPDSTAAAPRGNGQSLELFHDFGTILHAQSAQHDFVIDTRALGTDLVPLGVTADCGCARTEMILRTREGTERIATGQPLAEFAARPGELLVVRITIDTVRKEAADLKPADSRATLILQPASATNALSRLNVPIRFRFAIDSPVALRPFAILDFGEVPLSARPALLTVLAGDGTPMRFGPATCDDPRVQLELEPRGEETRLHVRFLPAPGDQQETLRAIATVQTDHPGGYVLRIPVVARLVPDLVVRPMAKLSLGMFDFESERPEQFVLVTDHDRSRTAEFVVSRIVDAAGKDCSSLFHVELQAQAGDARTTRVVVRYAGGALPPTFRGELVLAKDPAQGPFLPIELVAFHRKRP